MHTSYLLNRMIEVTPDCIAKRLGQGVILSNVESADDSDALAAEFSLAPGALRRIIIVAYRVLRLKIVMPSLTFACRFG